MPGSVLKLQGGKYKARPPFTFVTAAVFGWRKSCRARVAVDKALPYWGLGTNSRNYPSSNDLDYRTPMSVCWGCASGRNDQIHSKAFPATRRAGTKARAKPFQKRETEGVFFEITPKFSFFETALRPQRPLSFIDVLPGPRFCGPGGTAPAGMANPKGHQAGL